MRPGLPVIQHQFMTISNPTERDLTTVARAFSETVAGLQRRAKLT